MTRNQRFRALFRPGEPFVCMGAFDAITAKLAEASGAQAIFVSGFVACGVEAGEPDMGALSQRDMFEHIRRVCRATSLPVFADADTGYGGMLDAQRTIRLWEEAGASCLHLEDQALPKKCGHFAGKQLVSQQEMVQKLKAMVEARRDPDFFIVARTDAIAVNGLEDAIARLTAYAAAGADGLYADAVESVEQMRELSRRLEAARQAAPVQYGHVGQEPHSVAERSRRTRVRLRAVSGGAASRHAQGRERHDGHLLRCRLRHERHRRTA